MPRATPALLVLLLPACAGPTLPRGHAHNDYFHPHPLHDALAAGCDSVEADVFLIDGDLRVGHERWLLRPGSLQSLYLEPLRARVQERGGAVQRAGERFWLLVDIKADGAAVYARLRTVLAGYADLLTVWRDGREQPGAVTVVLSGDRPRALVAADLVRWCALDGRLGDLDQDPPASLVPWISDSWGKVSEWNGREPLPPEERERLRTLAARAHAQGRRLRFWGAPDLPAAWDELAAAGVDWISTDRLAEFAAWRRGR